ncbi:MAG: tRNA lysidine(34) synthetase TilS [Boseongicola sp.]|nr:MAG: tRNA lysidine(34) synthetase TilS [Boseongicola sp.]
MSRGDPGALLDRCGLPFVVRRPERLGVAVSGGSDSMALLDLMVRKGAELGFPVSAVSVNHGLRAEAVDEVAHVATFCAARGIDHSVLEWSGWDGHGNLQAEARRARYQLIADWADGSGVDCVALGHTEDDQAETVLMSIARKSGVDGLAGMASRFERHGVEWIRPLLEQPREVLRDYLRSKNIRWCDDPSNEDVRFERVEVRRALKVLSSLGIDAKSLARVASNAGVAKSALDHYAHSEVAEHELVTEDRGDLVFPEGFTTQERQVPGEVARRLQLLAFQWVSGSLYPPRMSAVVDMNAEMTDADRHTLGGCVVLRQKGKGWVGNTIRITREFNAVKDVVSSTNGVWDGRWVLAGPHEPDLRVRALGEALKDCPNWRETGLARQSLLASPAIWRGEELIAAPLAGFANSWTASATGRGSFAKFLLSR